MTFSSQVDYATQKFNEFMSGGSYAESPDRRTLGGAINEWLTEDLAAKYVAYDYATWLKTVLSIVVVWSIEPNAFLVPLPDGFDEMVASLPRLTAERLTFSDWPFIQEDYFRYHAMLTAEELPKIS